ncbi:MAG: hypothetical protein RL120_07535, partial [Gammaproteobacteria bacterium]
LAELLREHRDAAELSRRLAEIVCDVDDARELFSRVSLQHLQRGRIDGDKLAAFLEKYRFRSDDRNRILALANTRP